MTPKVLAVICANGLGHFRRTIGILDRLTALGSVELVIACEKWQLDRSQGWAAFQRVHAQARYLHGVTQPGISWKTRAEDYDESLRGWERRLADHAEAHEADLMLSDNLVGALAVRSDAVLMGSFLWSDVLEHGHGHSAVVRDLVEHERALLAAHRPPMLCVGDIAMPGVLSRTDAIRLPWMCEVTGRPARAGPRDPPRVGVFGGATGAASGVLEATARALESDALVVVRGGEAEARYEDLDVVVCRPGIGTVTGCIAARVPMILAYEPANIELAHNAARLAELGVAIDCGSDAAPAEVADAARGALAPATLSRMSGRMFELRDDGLDEAARWLVSHLVSRLELPGKT